MVDKLVLVEHDQYRSYPEEEKAPREWLDVLAPFKILDRPRSERPFLLLIAGYPADGVKVPDISKKSLSDIATFL